MEAPTSIGTRPQGRYARFDEECWTAVKPEIEEFYLTRNLPLSKVMKEMEKRAFVAT